MRTTLAIDEDVMAAAKELAKKQHTSVGEVISALARSGLRSAEANRETRNGAPLLQVRTGTARVTPDLVRQLREELF